MVLNLKLIDIQHRLDTELRNGSNASVGIGHISKLLAELVHKNGHGDEHVVTKENGPPTLPGFYEKTTDWDFMVIRKNRLVAVVRLDAVTEEGNHHQQIAEAVYAAHAFQAAYGVGMFEAIARPFVGWLMLSEDATGARSPVTERIPHFPVRPEFQIDSSLQRYDQVCPKLMLENLYTAASVITSPATAARNGRFTEVSELTGLKNFVTTFAAHIAAEAAR